jgi:hypothetical protein
MVYKVSNYVHIYGSHYPLRYMYVFIYSVLTLCFAYKIVLEV